MAPIDLLSILLALTAGAAVTYGVIQRRRRATLRALAAAWEMHYSPHDPFRLSSRIAPQLRVPGAARVRLRDLIYGIEGDYYRYYFTVEYTLHSISARTRVRCVASFIEPRASREIPTQSRSTLCESDEALPVVDQYVRLKDREQAKERRT